MGGVKGQPWPAPQKQPRGDIIREEAVRLAPARHPAGHSWVVTAPGRDRNPPAREMGTS